MMRTGNVVIYMFCQMGVKRPGAAAYPKSTATFASGGQKPFREKVSGLPKAFHWDGSDTLFFFVPLCVSLWLKLDGGFRNYDEKTGITKNRC